MGMAGTALVDQQKGALKRHLLVIENILEQALGE